MRVIVYSEVVGYMWADLDNGTLSDELSTHRPDLETPNNTRLVQMQLGGENG